MSYERRYTRLLYANIPVYCSTSSLNARFRILVYMARANYATNLTFEPIVVVKDGQRSSFTYVSGRARRTVEVTKFWP